MKAGDFFRREKRLILRGAGIAACAIILLMLMNTSAQARIRCIAYHKVTPGDTLEKLADQYSVPWERIAEVNKLSYPYRLESGWKLCIPVLIWQTPTRTPLPTNSPDHIPPFSAVMDVPGNQLIIKSRFFPADAEYLVRIFGKQGIARLGDIKTGVGGELRYYFIFPPRWNSFNDLYVCLKNLDTDEIACEMALFPLNYSGLLSP